METPHWLLLTNGKYNRNYKKNQNGNKTRKSQQKPEKSTKVNKNSKKSIFAFLLPDPAFYPSSKPEQGLQLIFNNLQ